MKTIKAVVQNGPDIELIVHCPHHNGTTIIDEDTCHCSYCGNEIEDVNIKAWKEYEELGCPEPTIVV